MEGFGGLLISVVGGAICMLGLFAFAAVVRDLVAVGNFLFSG